MAPRKSVSKPAPKTPAAAPPPSGAAPPPDISPPPEPQVPERSPAPPKTPAPEAPAERVDGIVISPLRHDGKSFAIGDPVALEAADFAALTKAGVVKPG